MALFFIKDSYEGGREMKQNRKNVVKKQKEIKEETNVQATEETKSETAYPKRPVDPWSQLLFGRPLPQSEQGASAQAEEEK